ncbi:transglutaminase domain-containing protein [Mycoplasma sp. Mirounga ES2805-ORL]|uniref:transglutaminase domain-containing protein n=1 Tax=Mycoplasma sp. Mirounga ES2805-ORL TaxID=754514 RepID=UPI00197B128C|nr:transglutaminase domain-containing protein [Mycoplasma sp. Mirounga ES2805-ORL]QSF13425.1 hypothetical protein JXZ90_01980 [Mycoplasma sp. Mirounga ES2805-ORL]
MKAKKFLLTSSILFLNIPLAISCTNNVKEKDNNINKNTKQINKEILENQISILKNVSESKNDWDSFKAIESEYQELLNRSNIFLSSESSTQEQIDNLVQQVTLLINKISNLEPNKHDEGSAVEPKQINKEILENQIGILKNVSESKNDWDSFKAIESEYQELLNRSNSFLSSESSTQEQIDNLVQQVTLLINKISNLEPNKHDDIQDNNESSIVSKLFDFQNNSSEVFNLMPRINFNDSFQKYHFSKQKYVLDLNSKANIKLLDNDDNEVTDDVEYYILTSAPFKTLFSKTKSQEELEPLIYNDEKYERRSFVKINNDGSLTPRFLGGGWLVSIYKKQYVNIADIEVMTNYNGLKEKYKEKVKSIYWATKDMSNAMKIGYVYKYLIDTITYDMDYSGKGKNLKYALLEHKAVCEGYAWLFNYLMKKLGINSTYKVGKMLDRPTVAHAWNRVFLEDGWYYIDSTWGDSNRGIDWDYFLASQDYIGSSRELNEFGKPFELGKKYLLKSNKDDLVNKVSNLVINTNPVTIPPEYQAPQASFIGTSMNEGLLINARGCEYNLGDNNWIKCDSDSVKIKPIDYTSDLNETSSHVFVRKMVGDNQYTIPQEIEIDSYVKISINWIKNENGLLKNVKGLEYKLESETDWIQNTSRTLKLKKGRYQFRIPGGKNIFASGYTTVEV